MAAALQRAMLTLYLNRDGKPDAAAMQIAQRRLPEHRKMMGSQTTSAAANYVVGDVNSDGLPRRSVRNQPDGSDHRCAVELTQWDAYRGSPTCWRGAGDNSCNAHLRPGVQSAELCRICTFRSQN